MKSFLLNLWALSISRGFLVLLVALYALALLVVLLADWGEVNPAYAIGWRHLWVFVVLAAYFRAGVVFARKGVKRG